MFFFLTFICKRFLFLLLKEKEIEPPRFFFAAATGKLRGMFVQRNAVRLSEAPIFK
jgi:hypothetical protein